MTDSHDSTRRDFLTGKAVQNELRRIGDGIAEGLDAFRDEVSVPQAGDTVRLATRAMGCQWCVIMNPGPPRQVMVASDAFDFVRDAEQLLTIYRDDSATAELNREASRGWHKVCDELGEFLEQCDHLYQATAGAFDPATGSLIRLWKEARLDGRIPTAEEVSQTLSCSGFNKVERRRTDSGFEVKFDAEGVQLDFASIGKGYGIDCAAAHIEAEHINNFLVHGGLSSLIARGEHHLHDGWPVGIKNPLFTDTRYATILLKDAAMATSGSNIQYFRYHGKRYGHLLDPRTGMPADGLLSVTVIAPTATEADALSTAFYVMGLDKALKYCDDHPEIGAVIVPPPSQGRVLEPVVRNFPADRLFFEGDVSPLTG